MHGCLQRPRAAADTKPAKADSKTNAKAAAAAPAVTDSLAMLERAVAKDSTKFDNLYKLGIMYLDREKNAEAAQVFSKANQVKPKNVKVLVNLGVALDNLSKADDAQAYYRQAIAIAPNDSLASCRLATSLYAQGKFSESMRCCANLMPSSRARTAPTSRWAWRLPTRVCTATPSGCGRRWWSWRRPRPRPRARRRASTCWSGSSPGSDGAPPPARSVNMPESIYLDHNASTPVRPEVAEAMQQALRDLGANPSSAHFEASACARPWSARASRPRSGARRTSWCSSRAAPRATTAIVGSALAQRARPAHVCGDRHHAVHGAAEVLERLGGALGAAERPNGLTLPDKA